MTELITPAPCQTSSHFIFKPYWSSFIFRRHHHRPTSTLRSYMIEAQGRTYWHTRQHICPINTDVPPLFARPSKHTLQEPEENLIFTRPPTATQNPGVIWSKDTSQAACLPCCPTTKKKTTAKSIAISLIQDHLPTLVTPFCDHVPVLLTPFQDHIPILAQLQEHFAPRACINQLLTHIIALNDPPNTTPQEASQPPAEPTSPSTSVSNITSSPISSPASQNTTNTDSDSEDSTNDESILATSSEQQLWPHLPINYKETLLKKSHGCPQIRTFNPILIPLPTDTEDSHGHNINCTYKLSNCFSHHSL